MAAKIRRRCGYDYDSLPPSTFYLPPSTFHLQLEVSDALCCLSSTGAINFNSGNNE